MRTKMLNRVGIFNPGLLNDPGRTSICDQWDQGNSAAVGLHFPGANHLILRIIGTFDQNGRLKSLDEFDWSIIVKETDRIDCAKAGQYPCPVLLVHNGS